MNSLRRLSILLLLMGVLGSAITTSHFLATTRAEHGSRLRAQVDLAATLAVERLRTPVLRDNAVLTHAVLAELIAPSPAGAAHVVGLDGTVLASWNRGVPRAAPGLAPEASEEHPRYSIRTGHRPIGELVIEMPSADAGVSITSILVPGGVPLLLGLLGAFAVRRPRAAQGQRLDTERVAALEAELVEARSALDNASRAKSMFLANMSHEIRTPLNGVLGMADLLLGTSLDERQRRFAGTVRGSAESLLNIVNDLLDFSRVESGNLHLDRLDFCPRECVEEVVQLLGGQAHTKNIELVCAVEGDLPRLVRGDPARLRQVLVNLVGNAVKFTERGEVVVRVRARTDANDAVVFEIEIADTGIGIAPDMHTQIFDSFVQLDASTTRRYGGAGLGLAISRHLVELMGGSITLQSEPGVGTTFYVTLVMESVEDVPDRGIDSAATISRARVLVVDDNDTNRTVLSNQLDSWSIGHEAVASGPQALEALHSAREAGNPFSIAILDMQMPGMDGVTLAGHIRADRDLQSVRLMLLTSAVVDLSPEELREAGFAQFTSKPVRQSQLYNCLLRLASGAADRRQEAGRAPVPATSRQSRHFNGRVLLVEDNAINQEVARHMLESLGCEVAVAENGSAALERLEDTPVDLVLMDCQMPVMDGFETTEAIRERERAAGVSAPRPIIALTANALAGDREQCLAVGMDDYVSKPFKMEELERVLSRWLPTGSGGEMPREPGGSPVSENPPEVSAHALDSSRLEFIRSMQRPGRPDLVRKVVELYLDRAPELIESIASAVGSRDPRALQSAAHSLKSSSANLGATQVADAARELERFGREGDLTRADEMLAFLRDAYPPVRAALEHQVPPAGFPGERGAAG